MMDTLKVLGFEKIQTIYETNDTQVCRVKNSKGDTFLTKSLKLEIPTVEQQEHLEYEYKLLDEDGIGGELKACKIFKHYMGNVIIMEDIEALTLLEVEMFNRIRQGGKSISNGSLQWILSVFIHMVECLEQVHLQNLIHYDINPANFILLKETDKVCIVDFGKVSTPGKVANESNIMDIEGLAYISPERTGRMDRIPDNRTDFYSLGISMYELITGQKPFKAEESLELIHSHIALVPETPHSINSDIPEMISEIIMKLISKEPEARYQNAESITRDLKRCKDELLLSGSIEKFELGIYDFTPSFIMSKRIYGRDYEKEKIEELYRSISNGGNGVLLIAGEAGVGKTSLVEEVCGSLNQLRGFFASGKAEEFQKNIPYFVFIQIAKELTKTLLQESESQLKYWEECLLDALKGNGRIMTDLVPELKVIIGEQPKLTELGPAENKNRFYSTLCHFFCVFMGKDSQLTILIDDLQWIDLSSMNFITYLKEREDLNHLIIVGCYRNNEIKEDNPIYQELMKIQNNKETLLITLNPLEERQVLKMMADCFEYKFEDLEEFAGIVHRKTNGNPFFVKKMLRFLYEEKIIHFDRSKFQWIFDIKKAKSIEISDNIVEFLVNELLKLSDKTQEILKLAALMGRFFEIKSLSEVANSSMAEVYVYLKEAIEKEIIMSNSHNYSRAQELKKTMSSEEFYFIHDRVQQACIALMDESEQKSLHLKIANYKKEAVPQEQWIDYAMDMVAHFNACIDYIKTKEVGWEVARLNLYACQKAKASSAFYLAMEYIEYSVRIMPANAWTENYVLTHEIIRNYVECAYLNGKYEIAEVQTQVLLQNVITTEEQAEVQWMQSSLYNYQGKLEKAIEHAIRGLQLLKIHVPMAPRMSLLLKNMVEIKVSLIGKNKEKLLALPQMRNEKIKLAALLWNEINKAAYLVGNTNLFLLSILRRMQLTLHYGNSKGSGGTYISYALVLAVTGNLQGCDTFCEIARLSCEKEGGFESRPTIYFSSGFFGHAWNRSWKELEYWFESAMLEAIKVGDHHTIALTGAFMYAFKPDISLSLLIEKSFKQYPLVKQTNNKLANNLIFLMLHRLLNYTGLTDDLFSMSVSSETHLNNGGIGIVYSEEECLAELKEGNYLSAYGVYYKEKTYIHYLYEDYEGALKYLEESDKYMEHHTGTPYIVECTMCSFLVIAANIEKFDKKKKVKVKKRMWCEYKKMKKWAENCSVNFLQLRYIMEAEIERMKGKPYEAVKRYDLAIETARQNGFIRDEALANELAAKMFFQFGKERQGGYYLAEAYRIYKLWGAKAKVAHMEEKYAHLLNLARDAAVSEKAITINETLDMLSLVKATKAVAEEVKFPYLLQQIMKTIIENSGAEKAVILTKSSRVIE